MAGGAQPEKGEAESAAGQLGLTLSPTSLTQPGVMAAYRDRNRFLRMPLRFVLPFLLLPRRLPWLPIAPFASPSTTVR
ncbi:MAG: hypothetical protein E5X76_17530 [Mesorhizobium sp.]|nr:MAG: hypothetical protein E5X76_17530 [Mesorhizobium sp.]